MSEMEEVAEGLSTIKTIKKLSDNEIGSVITEILYRILFQGISAEDGVAQLMRYQGNIDIDFL